MIKEVLKKTHIYYLYRKFLTDYKRRTIEKLNNEYKIAIDSLTKDDVFEQKCKELEININSNRRKFYIIRNSNTKVGILGYLNVFLPHIAYAIYNSYIPVIDMQKYETIYQESNENVWETFFEQPCGCKLADINRKDKVIYCNEELWCRYMPSSNPAMSQERIKLYSKIYSQFIKFEENTKIYIEEECKKVLVNPQKTIAVIWRGTTYSRGKAKNHPIQPNFEMLKKDIDDILKKNRIENIYIASDEKSIIDYFNNYYSDKILVNKRYYYDTTDKVDYTRYNIDGSDINSNIFVEENIKYKMGLTYLSSINIVAHCDYLLAGACGGGTAALYMNNLSYKYVKIYDLGRYK